MLGGAKSMHFVIRRGVLGLNAPKPVVTEHHWEPGNVLVLFSDGLRGHWQWADFPHLATASATVTAQRLLDTLARDDDDATVVVVREVTHER